MSRCTFLLKHLLALPELQKTATRGAPSCGIPPNKVRFEQGAWLHGCSRGGGAGGPVEHPLLRGTIKVTRTQSIVQAAVSGR